ncbi:MAG: anti-toxin [Hyphomonadaceae bacterium]|nr:anti-toxin [Hyphomonadaceae bacterium]
MRAIGLPKEIEERLTLMAKHNQDDDFFAREAILDKLEDLERVAPYVAQLRDKNKIKIEH